MFISALGSFLHPTIPVPAGMSALSSMVPALDVLPQQLPDEMPGHEKSQPMPLALSELGSQGQGMALMGLWCLPHAFAHLQLFARVHRSVVG